MYILLTLGVAYIYAYMYQKTMKEETVNLRESEGHVGKLSGKKGKGEM